MLDLESFPGFGMQTVKHYRTGKSQARRVIRMLDKKTMSYVDIWVVERASRVESVGLRLHASN